VAVFGTVLLWARAPFAAKNFYAEDGSRFYHDAITIDFVDSLRKPMAGYYHLVPRVIGSVTALGPVSTAALVNYLLVVMVVAWISSTIYVSSVTTLKRPSARLVLAMGITLLPIVGFESIANSTNLHFLLLCGSSVVLLGQQSTRWQRINGTVLVVATGLSTPLLVSLLPLVVMRSWYNHRESDRPGSPVIVGWMLGVAGQLFFVFLASEASRELGDNRSLQKTVFLFLDRVVGYNYIPFWPRISGESYSGSVSTLLVGRAFVGLLVVALIAFLLYWAARTGFRSTEPYRVVAMVLVTLVGGAFWLSAGMLFSTEPRYAVFPAFCIGWSLLIATELVSRAGEGHGLVTPRQRSVGVVVLILAIYSTHWTPSELRRSGPTWSDGLRVAEEICATTDNSTAAIRLLPLSAIWEVELPCDRLES
jgi:hypothetical protein